MEPLRFLNRKKDIGQPLTADSDKAAGEIVAEVKAELLGRSQS